MTARTLGAALALALTAVTAHAQAPSWTVPAESQRCPSKWGAADERGSMNHQKPAAVMKAAQLIKTGEVIELAYVLGPSMAFFGTRRFDVHTKRTFMNVFSNMRGSNEEIVVTELGQVGTQFDGFAHQTHLDSWYNCQKVAENADRSGFKKYGIHGVGQLFTRGVMIDVAGFKGVEMLGDNYEITVEDLEGAMKKQNITLAAGDAVLIHTGWGKLYGKDNPRYVKSCPGLGVKAAEWLIAKDPMLLGADNWPVEVVAQSGQAALAAGASARAGRERRASAREREARRARAEGRVGIRLHHAAVEDPGRLGLDRLAGRGAVSSLPRTGVLPPPLRGRGSRCLLARRTWDPHP